MPLIQFELDNLPPGRDFKLAESDATRLFGVNDAAVGRISKFAAGHRCRAHYDAGGLIFHKLFQA